MLQCTVHSFEKERIPGAVHDNNVSLQPLKTAETDLKPHINMIEMDFWCWFWASLFSPRWCFCFLLLHECHFPAAVHDSENSNSAMISTDIYRKPLFITFLDDFLQRFPAILMHSGRIGKCHVVSSILVTFLFRSSLTVEHIFFPHIFHQHISTKDFHQRLAANLFPGP